MECFCPCPRGARTIHCRNCCGRVVCADGGCDTVLADGTERCSETQGLEDWQLPKESMRKKRCHCMAPGVPSSCAVSDLGFSWSEASILSAAIDELASDVDRMAATDDKESVVYEQLEVAPDVMQGGENCFPPDMSDQLLSTGKGDEVLTTNGGDGYERGEVGHHGEFPLHSSFSRVWHC